MDFKLHHCGFPIFSIQIKMEIMWFCIMIMDLKVEALSVKDN